MAAANHSMWVIYLRKIKDLSTRNSGCTVRVHCHLGLCNRHRRTIPRLKNSMTPSVRNARGLKRQHNLKKDLYISLPLTMRMTTSTNGICLMTSHYTVIGLPYDMQTAQNRNPKGLRICFQSIPSLLTSLPTIPTGQTNSNPYQVPMSLAIRTCLNTLGEDQHTLSKPHWQEHPVIPKMQRSLLRQVTLYCI